MAGFRNHGTASGTQSWDITGANLLNFLKYRISRQTKSCPGKFHEGIGGGGVILRHMLNFSTKTVMSGQVHSLETSRTQTCARTNTHTHHIISVLSFLLTLNHSI
jgi:hypothetical protein